MTFDLSRLRNQDATAGFTFTGVIGFGSGPGGAGTVADFSVLVDQKLQFQKLKLKKDESAAFDITIPAEASTLTLIATEGGDGIGHDLLFLGDAKLSLVKAETAQSAADKQRLMELREEAARIEKTMAGVPAAEMVYAVTPETPPEVRVLRRGNPEDPQQVVSPGVPGRGSAGA